ncbi:MAG: hypothetical protein F2561_00975 [Actinobacteria bacterium]|nr:hypothetical protein [Actinomycetota bacterium]MTA17857.1 hypothetical protein [Actinomycetota bacterium]
MSIVICCMPNVVDAPPKTYHSPLPSCTLEISPASTALKPEIDEASTKNELTTMPIPIAVVRTKMTAAQMNPAFDRFGTTIGEETVCVMH